MTPSARTAEPADAPACPPAPPPEITIEPAPARWGRLLEEALSRPKPDRRRRFREQLGLPSAGAVVMTGHQVSLWHAGILSKFIAADRAARALKAAPAWIVVDQDEHEYTAVTAPVKESDGALAERTLQVTSPGAVPPLGAPSGLCPSFEPSSLPELAFACDSVREGLERARRALAAHADEPTAARQLAAALAELMRPLLTPAPTCFVTELCTTDLFAEFVKRLKAEPRVAISSYNAAVRAAPASGVAELSLPEDDARIELPLWRMRAGEARRRVFVEDLDGTDLCELAPRALVVTGLVRLAACDLFIHGTGGAAYDAITERWLAEWLGETLAPATVVSATLRLPLAPLQTDGPELQDALWRAHAARHNPNRLDPSDPELRRLAERKRGLVERIEQQRRAGRDPAADFQALHDLLADYRRSRKTELRRLDEAARSARRAASARELAEARTWPFVLHDEASLRALAREFDNAFA